MRITLLIEKARADDAGIILETIGFVPSSSAPEEVPQEGRLKLLGDLPEDKLSELKLIDGIVDWFIPPAEEAPAADGWPWSQKPETD